MNKKNILITILGLSLLIFPKNIWAQQNAISLAVTPPLFEVVIKPGKEVKQVYNITNNGSDTLLVPKILYFDVEDDAGNVSLTENPAPAWIKYSRDPFELKAQETKQFNVLVSPPEDEEEIDHFVTLIFETVIPSDVLFQNETFYKSQIGTNILITISKDGNPKKSAEIVEFKATKIVDSIFGDIKYEVKLKNNGNSYWKPIGKIIFNDTKSIKMAPQNVLSGSNRNILCLSEENLVECKISKSSVVGLFDIGKRISTLEFSVDDDPKVYKAVAETFVFPFTSIGGLLLLLTLYRVKGIFKVWRKRKS